MDRRVGPPGRLAMTSFGRRHTPVPPCSAGGSGAGETRTLPPRRAGDALQPDQAGRDRRGAGAGADGGVGVHAMAIAKGRIQIFGV